MEGVTTGTGGGAVLVAGLVAAAKSSISPRSFWSRSTSLSKSATDSARTGEALRRNTGRSLRARPL